MESSQLDTKKRNRTDNDNNDNNDSVVEEYDEVKRSNKKKRILFSSSSCDDVDDDHAIESGDDDDEVAVGEAVGEAAAQAEAEAEGDDTDAALDTIGIPGYVASILDGPMDTEADILLSEVAEVIHEYLCNLTDQCYTMDEEFTAMEKDNSTWPLIVDRCGCAEDDCVACTKTAMMRLIQHVYCSSKEDNEAEEEEKK